MLARASAIPEYGIGPQKGEPYKGYSARARHVAKCGNCDADDGDKRASYGSRTRWAGLARTSDLGMVNPLPGISTDRPDGLDPLLTIEQQGGKRGQARVTSTKEIPEVRGIG